MSNEKRNKAIQKIRALLNMTVGRGATEAEAAVAMKKVGELMAEYNLSMTEIELGEVQFFGYSIKHKGHNLTAADSTLNKICDLVGVKVWISRDRKTLHFYGEELGCLLAEYLYRIIETAIDYETEKFKKSDLYVNAQIHRKTLTSDFQWGMVGRLNERLKAMKDDELKSYDKSQTSLVVLKNALLDEALQKIVKFKSDTPVTRQRMCDAKTFAAGREAANNVNLNAKGIAHSSGSGEPLRLTKAS